MRIAAFNVENLFDRADAFNQNLATATTVIQAVADLNTIFEHEIYSPEDKNRIVQLFETLSFNRFNEGPLARIRKIRNPISKRPRNGPIEIIANGRGDWIGWAELKDAPVNEVAILNTGRVIRDVNADILAVVEAENRVSLKMFTEFVHDQVIEELPVAEQPERYKNIMLIDGNDDRGIDVGMMTKDGYDIDLMRSHVSDLRGNGFPIFSRDCPEYLVITPGGNHIWVLPNHFKSKHGGNMARSDQKRLEQAIRTREIYNALIDDGEEFVVVLGDLNDTPDRPPLEPLLAGGGPKDVSDHPNYEVGQFNVPASNTHRGIGTYKSGNDNYKIDYLLLSPALFNLVSGAGVFRKGAWPGSRPVRWDTYPQLKKKVHVASDHHVIWADIELP